MQVKALAAALALVMVPAAAFAGADTDVRSTEINYNVSELGSQASAEAMYDRVKMAARRVCDSPAPRTIQDHQDVASCEVEAIDRAVRDTGSDLLFAVHAQATGAPNIVIGAKQHVQPNRSEGDPP